MKGEKEIKCADCGEIFFFKAMKVNTMLRETREYPDFVPYARKNIYFRTVGMRKNFQRIYRIC